MHEAPATFVTSFAFLGILTLLALTVLGAPAPQHIGWIELSIATVSLVLSASGVAHLARYRRKWNNEQVLLALVCVMFVLVCVLSVTLAVIRETPLQLVFRALIPYLVFLPISAIAFSGLKRLPDIVCIASVLVGVGQSLYLLGLFAVVASDATGIGDILLRRTTLLDPRTTIPAFLACSTLVLPVLAQERMFFRRMLALFLVVLGVLTALSTQTRAQVLAIAMALISFAILFAVWRMRMRAESYGKTVRFLVTRLLIACSLIAVMVTGSTTVRSLFFSLVLRTQVSADNGRIEEEWIPAVKEVLGGETSAIMLGIGPGVAFLTGAGESRTFAHNQMVHWFVYGGVVGVVTVIALQLTILAVLIRRAFREKNPLFLGFAAQLIALIVYAQLFAVHKLLSFNLAIALILMVAFSAHAGDAKRTSANSG